MGWHGPRLVGGGVECTFCRGRWGGVGFGRRRVRTRKIRVEREKVGNRIRWIAIDMETNCELSVSPRTFFTISPSTRSPQIVVLLRGRSVYYSIKFILSSKYYIGNLGPPPHRYNWIIPRLVRGAKLVGLLTGRFVLYDVACYAYSLSRGNCPV